MTNINSKKLLELAESKEITIGIIGLGYVGMPLALSFVKAGFQVIGFDIDKTKIEQINRFESYIWSISSSDLSEALKKGLTVTNDMSKSSTADVLIICVPTPLNKNDQPDLKYVLDSTDAILPFLRNGQLISLESTTYPGTTEEEILPRIEKAGYIVGEDIFLCYSPEREDPGNESYSTRTIPKIVGGYSKACLELGVKIYSKAVIKVVPVSSTRVAEMSKLHENIYRSINIGLVNEMKMVCDKMKIDIHEVIRAANTKPFGFNAYYPGPGVGGHCIPIDPLYLSWKARELSIETKFIDLASKINRSMPAWILKKVSDELNIRNTVFDNLQILFVGISYKKNVDDIRESPSIELMKLFKKNNSNIHYSDPYIPELKIETEVTLKSVKLNHENIRLFDIVVITTDHDNIDYKLILKSSKLIVDTRGVYKMNDPKIIKA